MRRLPSRITATQIRDIHACEHRFALDLREDPATRDDVGGFVEMLWRQGLAHENVILDGLPGQRTDLRDVELRFRAEATEKSIAGRAPVILGAAIGAGDVFGMPDLIRLDPDHGYVAGDVKAGAALETGGPEGLRPKAAFAVQLTHYASIMARLGWGSDDTAIVIGRSGKETAYDLNAPLDRAGSTPMSLHGRLLSRARLIRNGAIGTIPAASAGCAQCHWRTRCRAELAERDDPTLIPDVGRSVRDRLPPELPTVAAIAALTVADYALPGGRCAIPGVGIDRLARLRDRATLLTTPGATAYARRPLDLPVHGHEIHYDVESDPLQDGVVYLHGMLERIATPTGVETRHSAFFADRLEDEGAAFAAAWSFLAERPGAHVYVWSRFERTSMRALQARHPHVCTADDVEALFAPGRCTDLYTDVTARHTEWPLHGYGLKKIARHVGFEWRDADPSGAASIAWFADWLAGGDPAVRQRIVDYNEDDCAATAAILDALRLLEVRP